MALFLTQSEEENLTTSTFSQDEAVAVEDQETLTEPEMVFAVTWEDERSTSLFRNRLHVPHSALWRKRTTS